MRHPNIVTFMGAAYQGTDLYIVTEYVPKGALRGLIKRPEIHLSWQARGRIALDIACASKCLSFLSIFLTSSSIVLTINFQWHISTPRTSFLET